MRTRITTETVHAIQVAESESLGLDVVADTDDSPWVPVAMVPINVGEGTTTSVAILWHQS